MNPWRPLAFAVAFAPLVAAPPLAAQTSPAAAPREFEPTASDTETLVRQLGDADFRKRDEAVEKLRATGPAASLALKVARENDDPEIAGRAEGLLRELERPARFDPRRTSAGLGRVQMGANDVMRMHVGDGFHDVAVRDADGRTVRINAGPGGIRMSVTSVENGKPVTRSYQARTPEQLKQQSPEAFALYNRWTGQRGVLRNRQDPAVARRQVNAELHRLRRQQQEQFRRLGRRDEPLDGQDPPAREMVDAFKELQRQARVAEAGVDPLPVPDPLPPARPGRQLGILALEDPDEGVTVVRVLPGGRAETLGLQPFDVIKTLNGKNIAVAADLQRVLAKTKDPLIVEATRDGEPIKLGEAKKANAELRD